MNNVDIIYLNQITAVADAINEYVISCAYSSVIFLNKITIF